MRRRFNNLQGQLAGAISATDTAINFSAALTYQAGTPLPTIAAPDYLAISLEPGTPNFEVVLITAYVSGGTAATLVRGAEGTTARVHGLDPNGSGARFSHIPTISDFINTGPIAARPAAGVANRYYFATDVGTAPGALYLDDGSAWQWVTGGGGPQVFNVKDPIYGAKGDGITDDTAAMVAAQAACVAAGGGIVYLPPGRYVVTTSGAAPFTMGNDVTFVGAGADASVIQVGSPTISAGGNALFRPFGTDTNNGGTHINRVAASDLAIDGTYFTNAMLMPYYCDHLRFRRVDFLNSGSLVGYNLNNNGARCFLSDGGKIPLPMPGSPQILSEGSGGSGAGATRYALIPNVQSKAGTSSQNLYADGFAGPYLATSSAANPSAGTPTVVGTVYANCPGAGFIRLVCSRDGGATWMCVEQTAGDTGLKNSADSLVWYDNGSNAYPQYIFDDTSTPGQLRNAPTLGPANPVLNPAVAGYSGAAGTFAGAALTDAGLSLIAHNIQGWYIFPTLVGGKGYNPLNSKDNSGTVINDNVDATHVTLSASSNVPSGVNSYTINLGITPYDATHNNDWYFEDCRFLNHYGQNEPCMTQCVRGITFDHCSWDTVNSNAFLAYYNTIGIKFINGCRINRVANGGGIALIYSCSDIEIDGVEIANTTGNPIALGTSGNNDAGRSRLGLRFMSNVSIRNSQLRSSDPANAQVRIGSVRHLVMDGNVLEGCSMQALQFTGGPDGNTTVLSGGGGGGLSAVVSFLQNAYDVVLDGERWANNNSYGTGNPTNATLPQTDTTGLGVQTVTAGFHLAMRSTANLPASGVLNVQTGALSGNNITSIPYSSVLDATHVVVGSSFTGSVTVNDGAVIGLQTNSFRLSQVPGLVTGMVISSTGGTPSNNFKQDYLVVTSVSPTGDITTLTPVLGAGRTSFRWANGGKLTSTGVGATALQFSQPGSYALRMRGCVAEDTHAAGTATLPAGTPPTQLVPIEFVGPGQFDDIDIDESNELLPQQTGYTGPAPAHAFELTGGATLGPRSRIVPKPTGVPTAAISSAAIAGSPASTSLSGRSNDLRGQLSWTPTAAPTGTGAFATLTFGTPFPSGLVPVYRISIASAAAAAAQVIYCSASSNTQLTLANQAAFGNGPITLTYEFLYYA
jgi:Pectate lyase superfamily protein